MTRTQTDARVHAALTALRAGRPVLVLDDADRENEGDLILAAQNADPAWVGFAVRHGSGLLCAAMDNERADALDLPLMVPTGGDHYGTAYTVTVDAAHGVTTGIGARDRTTTLHALAAAEPDPAALVRPGHVLPLRARDGGVLTRRGHTEAAVDLCRLAGLRTVGMIVELVHDDGEVMRAPAVHALGAEHDLPVLTIEELADWRNRHDRVQQVTRTLLPTEHGTFTVYGYRDLHTGDDLVALVGQEGDQAGTVTVRIHSECLTGDALGSWRCDCGPQLRAAMARIGRDGGVLVLVRGQEGRGVGLLDKLRAYALQDTGVDTVDAQHRLGLPVDAREYGGAAAVLADLGVRRVHLLTGNPNKSAALVEAGIEVESTEALLVGARPENAAYLRTKRDRLGHQVPVQEHPAGEQRSAAPKRVAS